MAGQAMKGMLSGGKACILGTATFVSMGILSPAFADDIDVYTAQIDAQSKPNILFVLDYSGSMEFAVGSDKNTPAPVGQQRIDYLRDALNLIVNDNGNHINVGLGSLFQESSSGIKFPISDLGADASTVDPAIPAGKYTVADIIKTQLDLVPHEDTATVDALVEAAQYFRGSKVTHNDAAGKYDKRNKPPTWNDSAGRYTGGHPFASIAASYTPRDAYDTATNKWAGATYDSPITNSCQSNSIVLISDGLPTVRNVGKSLESVIGMPASGCENLKSHFEGSSSETTTEGNCGPEVVRAMAKYDQKPGIPDSRVRTFTVGFSITSSGEDYLERLASEGDGLYFPAENPEKLNKALKDIVNEIIASSETFVSPSVDIDRARFSHDNRAYFNLFTPDVRRGWSGNLKGYFIVDNDFVDIHGNPATDVVDGRRQFAAGAQSFWSSSIDGNEVTLGGANDDIIAGGRNLLTYTGDTIPNGGVALKDASEHALGASNTLITNSMLGLPSASPARTAALDWIADAPMGAPLHSRPVEVDYGSRKVVYVMTTQGLVHAIDATTPTDPKDGDTSGGKELFAFMPKELLVNLPPLAAGDSNGDFIYGLDGQITRWHTDSNNDGVVNNGEKVLLVLGMRRGGESYYALDVSKPTSPKLMWRIGSDQSDFAAMAQSWSRASLITVKHKGTAKKVLAFAGGYDAGVLDGTSEATASRGNAIYMVDDRGNLLWKVDEDDHANFDFAIASDLTTIDSDGDGVSDRIYVGDVAGQLWRIDFDDISADTQVTRLASFDDSHQQPIFYPPSVSLQHGKSGNYLAIAIGTGNRTDPLDGSSKNHIFVYRDTDVKKGAPASAFTTARKTDFYDASNNLLQSSDATVASNARTKLANARGWSIALAEGEKALSGLTTFEGKLLATTFEPDSSASPDPCAPKNAARLYSMDVTDATPISLKKSGKTTLAKNPDDRITLMQENGIPSSPQLLVQRDSDEISILVGREFVDFFDMKLTKVYWHAK